jgi:hypothetical protein
MVLASQIVVLGRGAQLQDPFRLFYWPAGDGPTMTPPRQGIVWASLWWENGWKINFKAGEEKEKSQPEIGQHLNGRPWRLPNHECSTLS